MTTAALNWLLSKTFDLSHLILILDPDPNDPNCKVVVARISDALCHARFYGDNPASDEVPLMKILQVRGGGEEGEGKREGKGRGREKGGREEEEEREWRRESEWKEKGWEGKGRKIF